VIMGGTSTSWDGQDELAIQAAAQEARAWTGAQSTAHITSPWYVPLDSGHGSPSLDLA
jgi:hypothetical protein